ncbi:MAG: sugar ABC transporter permease [Actinobacteria bacterium]|nr:sugar ABC transporter permease [Actinomycetota bacterium]
MLGIERKQAVVIPHRRDRRGELIAYTAPATVWFLVFMIGPFVAMFYLAFTEWNSLLATPEFNGIQNFLRLPRDPAFGQAVRNTLVQIVVELALVIPLGFMLGYLLVQPFRGRGFLSVVFFVPILVSASARAMMFVGLYMPDGFINNALSGIGLDRLTHVWLADPATVLGSVILVDVWASTGFNAVMIASRLSSVPSDLFEAAGLDGASHWSKMWRIAFPIILDFIATLTMLHFLWALLSSAQNILLLTRGGPGNSSMTLGYMLYERAFGTSQLGYSQAIGVVLFFVGILGLLVIRRLIRQRY